MEAKFGVLVWGLKNERKLIGRKGTAGGFLNQFSPKGLKLTDAINIQKLNRNSKERAKSGLESSTRKQQAENGRRRRSSGDVCSWARLRLQCTR